MPRNAARPRRSPATFARWLACARQSLSSSLAKVGVGDRVFMQENACYSVITPEGCAAILYGERTPERAAWAAAALKITAPDLLALQVIDTVVPEPAGGAHRYPKAAMALVGGAIAPHLEELMTLPLDEVLTRRYAKFRRMGEAAIMEGMGESTP